MTINQRVQKIVDEFYAGNKRAFSKAVGIAPTVTENIVGTRHNNPSFDVARKIAASVDNLSMEWFFMGKGKMLNTKLAQYSSVRNVAEDQAPYTKKSATAKPFISISDIPDTGMNFKKAIKAKGMATKELPLSDYDFSIQAFDNSMLNADDPDRSIEKGDFIACKLQEEIADIRSGNVYVLSTSKGMLVRKVEHSHIKDNIRCVPFNSAYFDSFDLPLSEVFDYALVVGTIRVKSW